MSEKIAPIKILIVVDLPGVASVFGDRGLFDNVSSVPGGKAFHAAVGNMQFLYSEEPSSIGFLFADTSINRDLATHLVTTAGYNAAIVTDSLVGGNIQEIGIEGEPSVNELIQKMHSVGWLPVMMPSSDGTISINDINVVFTETKTVEPANGRTDKTEDHKDVLKQEVVAEPVVEVATSAPTPEPVVSAAPTDPSSSPPPPPAWLQEVVAEPVLEVAT